MVHHSTYNAFFMDLPVSSFVSHSSLLTVKSVDLEVAHDGFPLYQKSFVFFIVTILIAEVLFQPAFDSVLCNGLNISEKMKCNGYFTFQTIIDITGARGTISIGMCGL